MVKSKAVGGGIGAFFNNPGALALGALAVALLFFSGDIRKAFGSIGESLGNLKFPDINLPDIKFPDFNLDFPDIKFPDFNLDFGDPFKGIQEGIDNIINQFTNPLDPGREEGSTGDIDVIPDTTGGLAERRRASEEAAAIAEQEKILAGAGDIGGSEIIQAQNELIFRARQDPITDIIQNVQTGITDQAFRGGGPSFIGGSVTEIPLERLTLGQIIDRLGVSASRAASLRAEAIGFSPEEQAFLNQGQEISPLGDFSSTPQTSEGFEGLTPEEIALRLTGGPISNF